MISFRLMRTFVSVVEAGSFAAAANQLGQSPSIISKQVAELERHLGAQLMHRTTRKMSITEIGEYYYEACRETLDRIGVIEDEIAALQGTARGHLIVHVPHSIGILHLGRLITAFCETYPAITASVLTEESPLRAFEFDRQSDVVLHLGPVTAPNLVARELTRIVWLPFASPAYLERHGTPQTPDDLAAHNCLVHQTVFPQSIWRLDGPDGRSSSITVRGTVAANSVMILTEAVQDGIGISLLPSFCTHLGIADGSLVRVLPEWEGPTRNLYAAYKATRMVPQRLRLFVEFMTLRLRTPPWTSVSKREAL